MNPKSYICIIDDEPAHRMITKRVTQRSTKGIIIEAENLNEVAPILENYSSISLFIVDLNIKGVRSTEILPLLRKHSPEGSLLMVSTSSLETDIFECYSSGVDCYLFKGDNPADYQRDLAQAIKFLLRSKS